MNYDVIVVGAGHAGLSASYCLKKAGLSHVVFEKGRVGESWRSQRWDSFVLNTPNWCSEVMQGGPVAPDPKAFLHRDGFVDYLEAYRSKFDLPVQTGVKVLSVKRSNSGFQVTVSRGSEPREELQAKNVIVASGLQNVPKIPSLSAKLPDDILQMHAADYRNVDMLPQGAVLVVGSGQSGFQIAEDLLEAGRQVYFSSSRVGRLPRRYRGRDLIEWMNDAGAFDLAVADLKDPAIRFETVPHVSGVGERGRTVSHQYLAKMGAEILGKLNDFEKGTFKFNDDAAENVRFSDEKSAEIKGMIDGFLTKQGIPFPPLEDDPRDVPDIDASCASKRLSLHADGAGVRSVIWCTGFGCSFDWLDAPLDERGHPVHKEGVSPIEGLYYIGFPWLRTRKSGIVAGAGDDAAFIVGRIAGALSNH